MQYYHLYFRLHLPRSGACEVSFTYCSSVTCAICRRFSRFFLLKESKRKPPHDRFVNCSHVGSSDPTHLTKNFLWLQSVVVVLVVSSSNIVLTSYRPLALSDTHLSSVSSSPSRQVDLFPPLHAPALSLDVHLVLSSSSSVIDGLLDRIDIRFHLVTLVQTRALPLVSRLGKDHATCVLASFLVHASPVPQLATLSLLH